jgi:hypothetical protein
MTGSMSASAKILPRLKAAAGPAWRLSGSEIGDRQSLRSAPASA